MAAVIPMVARKALTWAGRAVAAGEVFDVQPIEAAALTYRRKAIFAPRHASSRARREYRRRDMVAER